MCLCYGVDKPSNKISTFCLHSVAQKHSILHQPSKTFQAFRTHLKVTVQFLFCFVRVKFCFVNFLLIKCKLYLYFTCTSYCIVLLFGQYKVN